MSAPNLPSWGRGQTKSHGSPIANGSSPYGEAALTAECQRVAAAKPGTRNTTLNTAAFALAQLASGGEISETTVRRRLKGAALAAGLEEEEISSTLDSALLAGAKTPRHAPIGKENSSVKEAADRVWADEMKVHPKPDWRNTAISADALQVRVFPPVSYVIPDLIPEGLSMLCGRPKVGKSWAALDLALAVSGGGMCLGRSPAQGDVLYCALEDNYRRLKNRLAKLAKAGGTWPRELTLTTTWRRLDKGGVKDIAEWIREAKNPRLVILDTLAGVKPIRTNSGYAEDYESLTALHRLANEVGIAILVLHHTRKLEADDPLDTISGTLGLAGCADTALVFVGTPQGMTLYVRGRDIEEAEHAVSFDKATCRWNILGNAADIQMSDTRKAILKALKQSGDALGPKDIADAAGLKEGVVKQRLLGMVPAGEVIKVSHGRYKHPETP